MQVRPLVITGEHSGIIVTPSRLASNVTAPGQAESKSHSSFIIVHYISIWKHMGLDFILDGITKLMACRLTCK